MDTNVNYTIVGGFVIILLAFIALGIVWLSSGLSMDQYSTYRVYMQESVSGLSVDAPVEYNGVNVGSIASIELNRQNPHLVDLLLKIKSSTPINRGTSASLSSRGLTGIAFIALLDKGTDLSPIRAEKGQEYPVIPTSPSLFLRLDAALKKLNDSLSNASNSIQQAFDPENLGYIKETLFNLSEITKNLAAQNQKISTILENTSIASREFAPFMQASRNTLQTFATQTLPATSRMMSNLDVITQNFLEISNELKQNPAMLIRGKTPQPLGPGEK